MQLTDKQLIHRAYLRSPLWESKRLEAIAHYGPICRRCGNHGTDVHHKTYARTGGSELLSDLEILCRSCHESHHRIERATRRKKFRASKAINATALARYLTPKQRRVLQDQFSKSWGQIYLAIIEGDKLVTNAALAMSGKSSAYLPKRTYTKTGQFNGFSQRHIARLMS